VNVKRTGERRALGRGLDALIPPPAAAGAGVGRDYFRCRIEKIKARADQPRRRFDEERLEELKQSIVEQGIIQPIVVRRADDGFEIIAGERRWRAAQRAGLTEVPVVVQDVTSAQAFEMALVENLQREDLNPLERADAYRRLVEDHGLKHDELARRVGKARSTITNALRLLALPDAVRGLVATGELSEGHARALLGAADEQAMRRLAARVVQRGLSVRQTERLVQRGDDTARHAAPAPRSPQVAHLESRLRRRLGCTVVLKDADGKGSSGTIELRYTSADELERLLDILLGQ
jgi:ParB family chromosome partitioning protein